MSTFLHPQPHSSSSSSQPNPPPASQAGPHPKPKRRKVNHACLYCRRSHMTCDEGRPCQRCIKREIGHLCHDEPRTRHESQGQGQGQVQQRQASVGSVGGSGNGSGSMWGPESITNGLTVEYPTVPSSTTSTSTTNSFFPQQQQQRAQWVSPYRPGTFGTEFAALTEFLETIDRDLNLNGTGTVAPAETQGQGHTTRQGSYYSTSAYSELSGSVSVSVEHLQGFLSTAELLHAQAQTAPQHHATLTFPVSNQYPLLPPSSTSASTSTNASTTTVPTLPSGHLHSTNPNSESVRVIKPGTAPAVGVMAQRLATSESSPNDSEDGDASTSTSTVDDENQNQHPLNALPTPSSKTTTPVVEGNGGASTSANGSGSGNTAQGVSPQPTFIPPSSSLLHSTSSLPSTLSTLSTTSSLHRFLLTAADQESGSRSDRLARVIRSKYEAGLLKPYNYVKGYARLSRWMEGNVSQESKARVLRPLSVLRPKFRSISQSLRPIDLVFIEEAFERLLLDYDRVFASMGVPACLWRRTGEIYKGNREFSELIGVDGYLLREGKVCIYELMAEESAVNYWEKYGTVAFDSSQKAVLTSCVLRYKPNLDSFASFASKTSSSSSTSVNCGPIKNKNNYTTPNTYGSYSTYPAPMMPPTTVLARTGMTTKLWAGDTGDTGDTYTPYSYIKEEPVIALPADEAAGAPPVQKGGGGAGVPVPTEEGLISCCFSFTIRRDKWGVPCMIVGNFVRC